MENLFGTIGKHEPSYLLASNVLTDCISISVEPGNGKIPAGTVMYRKNSVLYSPADTAHMTSGHNLVVLRDDVDTDTSAGIAVAAAAYRKAIFIAGKVLKADGSGDYTAVSMDDAVVLRMQGIEFSPMEHQDNTSVEADNRVALTITVSAGDGGSASADKQTAKKGETVTLTISPNSGKVVDEIEVVDGGVTVDDNNQFIMGDSPVEIDVSFKANA